MNFVQNRNYKFLRKKSSYLPEIFPWNYEVDKQMVIMELFLQADDPNYFSCFKFMCHNHHNQLCLMILRHKSTSLGYLFMSQWGEMISEFSWNYFWYVYDVEKHRKKSFKHFIFTSWLNTKATLAQQFFALSHSSLTKPSRDFNFFHMYFEISLNVDKIWKQLLATQILL